MASPLVAVAAEVARQMGMAGGVTELLDTWLRAGRTWRELAEWMGERAGVWRTAMAWHLAIRHLSTEPVMRRGHYRQVFRRRRERLARAHGHPTMRKLLMANAHLSNHRIGRALGVSHVIVGWWRERFRVPKSPYNKKRL